MKETRIAVLGAGPAGAAAAAGLARLGEAVTLIGEPRRFDAVEGVSQRVVDALRGLGFERALQALAPPSARSVIWNGRLSTANREQLVQRQRFDAALLSDVQHFGVQVVHGRVRKLASSAGRHTIEVEQHGRSLAVHADFVVEARGRAAPGKGAARVRGPETVSLLQYWQGPRGPARSAVQSCADGWAWMAALGDGRRYLQLTMDAQHAALPTRKALAAYCSARFRALEAAAPFLQDAVASAAPYARASTAILHGAVCGRDWIRVGDAAMAVDPLSGNGIFQSLSSALQAPAVVATLLHQPEHGALACDFHQRRIEALFERFARIGRDFYRQETGWPESPFWAARRNWPDEAPLHRNVTPATTQVARRPVVHHGRIVEDEVVVTADQPLGIWHVDGVAVAPLLRAVRAQPGRRSAQQALQQDCGLEAGRALHFARWMRAQGWID